MANKRQLEDQVARLTAAVDEMRARLSGLEGGGARPSGLDAPRSRRDLLRMGGAAALGAVGAVAMRGMPVMAATGDPVVAGQANVANATTTLSSTDSAVFEVLGVQENDFSQTALDAALAAGSSQFGAPVQGLGGVSGIAVPDFREGLDGWAQGSASIGVYGLTDSGYGLVGESNTGTSVWARRGGRIRQDPTPVTPPVYLPNEFEQVRDVNGALWLSNAAGNWRRASTFEVFPNSRRVYGNGVALAAGATVTNVDATQKINGGGPTGLPAGVAAAWCAVQSFEPAVLSIYPAGSADPNVGTYGAMGTAGISIQISYMMVPLNASGHFSFRNMKTKARIFFDVWGYITQYGG